PILRMLALPGAGLALTGATAPVLVSSGNAIRGFLGKKQVGLTGTRAAAMAETWAAYESLGRPGHRRAFFKTLRAVVDGRGQSVSAVNRLHVAARLPFQLIWGDRDPIIPVDHAYATHAAIPASRLAIFDGARHCPHAEAPAAAALTIFLLSSATQPG